MIFGLNIVNGEKKKIAISIVVKQGSANLLFLFF